MLNKEKIIKKVKKNAYIAEGVTVYDERITDLIEDAIFELKTGGVPSSVIEEGSPTVINVISNFVCRALKSDAGDTKTASWFKKEFDNKVFVLSLLKPGASVENYMEEDDT